jgi:crossover junction endodeoxyribonuclease RuvC
VRIVGIDPGFATVGYGVLDVAGRDKVVQDYGVITTPAHTPLEQRLITLHQDLSSVLTQWQPDVIVLEKFFFYRMANTILVAQARGVILLCVGQSGAALLEFSPTQVKQTLTGYGRADKQAVQQAVQRELNLTKLPRPDDAADALALALTGWFSEPQLPARAQGT